MKFRLKHRQKNISHPQGESSFIPSTHFDETLKPIPLTNKKIDVTMRSEKKNFIIDEAGQIKEVASIDRKTVSKREKKLVTEIGFYLITPLLAGVFLGLIADRAFSTKPTLTMVGLFLGVVATFYNLFKFLRDA